MKIGLALKTLKGKYIQYSTLCMTTFLLLGCLSNKNIPIAQKHLLYANKALKESNQSPVNDSDDFNTSRQLLMEVTCANVHWAQMHLNKIKKHSLFEDDTKSYEELVEEIASIKEKVAIDCSEIQVESI